MAQHRSHFLGTRTTVMAVVVVLLAALVVSWSVVGPVTRAAAVGLGTIDARVFDHVGTTGTSAENCITYDPVAGAPAGSSSWVQPPATAWTAHGSNTSCPNSLSTTRQSAIGVTPTSTTTATDGVRFPLAKIEHSNRPVNGAASRYTGKLALRMPSFNSPNEIVFDWSMWETTNGTTCEPGVPSGGGTNCRDEIKFTNQISSTTLTQAGVTYRVVIGGFEEIADGSGACPSTSGANLKDTFWTNEGGSTFACIYAALVQVRSVTVNKVTNGSGVVPTRDFGFSTAGTLAGSQWTAANTTVAAVAPNTPKQVMKREILRGDTATITELPTGDDRWAITALGCTQVPASGVGSEPLPQASANLAAGRLTLTNVPASPNSHFPDITCTVTNTYTPRSTLTLVKQLTGTPTGPATPANWTLTAVGGSTVSGQSGSATVTDVRVPAGTYALTETGTGSAGSGYVQVGAWSCSAGGTVSGSTVILADRPASDAAVTCTVSNRYATGSVQISKVITGEVAGFTGNNTTPFPYSYDCGPGSTGTGILRSAAPVTITGIPVGRSCSVTELQPTGNLRDGSYFWAAPTYSTLPVVIADGGTAAVTVTNSIGRNTGNLSISKVVPTGPGGYTGGPAREFPVQVVCTIGTTTVLQGTWAITTGAPTVIPDVPSTATCALSEALVRQPGDFGGASFEWSGYTVSPSKVTVGVGTTALATVTNNHVQRLGNLTIGKTVVGGGYLGGAAENFAVDYTCGTLTGSISLASGSTKTITGIPAGTSCQLQERAPAAELLAPSHVWGSPTWSETTTVIVADESVVRTVTNPTVEVFGRVSVSKAITGATGGVAAGTSFGVTLACTDGYTSPSDTTITVGAGFLTPELPVGTSCTVTETAPTGGLVDDSYAWGATPPAQTVTVQSPGEVAAVTVTNSVNRVYGGLQVRKELSDPAGQVTPGRTFALTWTCRYGNDEPISGTFDLAAGAVGSTPPATLLIGSVCTVSEDPDTLSAAPATADPSYRWGGIPAPVTVTLSAAEPSPEVSLTNTVSRVTGSFAVTKSVTGDGAVDGYSGTFGFTWACTAPGYTDGGAFTLAAGAAWSSPSGVPSGASCSVRENDIPAAAAGFAWGSTTHAVAGPAADGTTAAFRQPATGIATVAFTNSISRVTGAVIVTKLIEGETAGLSPGTTFPISLDCGPAGTFALTPAAGASATVDGIAIGSTCTLAESLPVDGLRDASYAWGEVAYDPQTVTVAGAEQHSTVTNTVTRVTRPVRLTKARNDSHPVATGRRFTGTWACTYERGTVAAGDWSATAGQTVELAAAVPLTAECAASEDVPAAASVDASYRWRDPEITGTTVTGDGTNTVTVTNTVDRALGAVTLAKELSGAVEGWTGEEPFTLTLRCPLAGFGVIERQIEVAVGESGTITDLPIGVTCTIGESSPHAGLADASYRWGPPEFSSATVTLTDAEPHPKATVTNPIERVRGTLQISKIVDDPFGAVLPDAGFTGAWTCTYPGSDPVAGSWTVTGPAGGTVTAQTGGADAQFLVGSVCSVTERTPTGGLADGSYAWADVPAVPAVRIAPNTAVVATVTNTVRRSWGALQVTKALTGAVEGVPAEATFDGTWTCALGGETFSGRFTLAIGVNTLFSAADERVPATARCSFVEDTPDPTGLVDGSYAYDPWTVSADDLPLPVADVAEIVLTNPVVRVYGSIEVRKEITGPAAPFVDSDRLFDGSVTCRYRDDEPVTFGWLASTGAPDSLPGILIGSHCSATETVPTTGPAVADPSFVWNAATVSGPAVVGTDVSLTVTNPTSRMLATFLVAKTVTGAVDGIADPAAARYPVTYRCVPAIGDPIVGTLVLVVGTDSRSASIPVGSACTVTEPADGLPALKDAEWRWQPPTFAVARAEAVAADRGVTFSLPARGEDQHAEPTVTVTNPILRTPPRTGATVTTDPPTTIEVLPTSRTSTSASPLPTTTSTSTTDPIPPAPLPPAPQMPLAHTGFAPSEFLGWGLALLLAGSVLVLGLRRRCGLGRQH